MIAFQDGLRVIYDSVIIAPLWKSGGYTGFALSFCNLSDENFRHTFLKNCEV